MVVVKTTELYVCFIKFFWDCSRCGHFNVYQPEDKHLPNSKVLLYCAGCGARRKAEVNVDHQLYPRGPKHLKQMKLSPKTMGKEKKDQMKLVHFSAQPLLAVKSTQQAGYPEFKPKGLWVSDGSTDHGWRYWCHAEQFNIERFKCATEVILQPSANILHLSNSYEILKFSKEYIPDNPEDPTLRFSAYPDWIRVGSDYQGIIISPYQWELRHHPDVFWYYAWDCASGCIWNADAVQELKPHNMEAFNVNYQ